MQQLSIGYTDRLAANVANSATKDPLDTVRNEYLAD